MLFELVSSSLFLELYLLTLSRCRDYVISFQGVLKIFEFQSCPCPFVMLISLPTLLTVYNNKHLLLVQSVLGIILGGGAGTRLYPLTKKRAKPAVPLGANYRLIDIPVSNCLNSNISKIYVLTQFNSASLNRHLSRAYGSNIGGYKNEGFVEVLAAQQSPDNPNWFQVSLLMSCLF